MGFFDKLFKGKGLYTDKRNPGMVCEMTLCGQQHLLSEFDLSYDPDNGMKEYFEAYAVFSEPVNAAVDQWITKPGTHRGRRGEVLPQRRYPERGGVVGCAVQRRVLRALPECFARGHCREDGCHDLPVHPGGRRRI